MTKANIRNIQTKLSSLRKIRKEIGIKRTELREALEDFEQLLDDLDSADECFRIGIREFENGLDDISRTV